MGGGGGGEILDQESPEKHESLIARYRGPNHYLYLFFFLGGGGGGAGSLLLYLSYNIPLIKAPTLWP